MTRRWFLAALMAIAVLSPVSPAAAGPSTSDTPVKAPDSATAVRQARASGARVEVTGLRSASTRIYATPRGTFVATIAAGASTQAAGGFGGDWTMINERHPDQQYWSYDRGEHAKVGYVEQAGDGWERYRSIWQIDLNALRGKQILSATFSSYLLHSYSCGDTWTDLYATDGIGPGTTWNTNWFSWPGDRWLANALNSNCDDAADFYTEWGSTKLRDWVAGATGNGGITLGLRASDEGTINLGWKKFDEGRTVLSVEFNSYPGVPDAMSVSNKPCAQGADRPYVGTTTPVLRARSSDPDGGLVNTWFAWGERNADGSIKTPLTTAHQDSVPSGGTAQVTVAPALVAGRTYGFRTQANDGLAIGPDSAFCEFTVDTTAPDRPPAAESADGLYLNDNAIHGGVGVSGSFRLSAGGVADVAGYRYGLASPPLDYVAAGSVGGTAIAAVTPDRRGTNKLYVQSVDRAGNTSDIAEYVFRAGSGRPPAGVWTLGETSGTTLADSSGKGHPATLSGGTLGQPSRIVDRHVALHLSGDPTNYAATTGGPIVPNDESFSVAAWARLTDNGTFRTAVAQDGVHASGFYLQYSKADDRWTFSLTDEDKDNAATTRISSTRPPRLGAWTHLVGTYDSATRRAALFVDGVEQGSVSVPPAWNPSGPLTIGRGLWNGAPVDFWAGELTDVRVWDRRIYPSEVAELAQETTNVGDWRFEEASGAAGDSSGFQRSLTLAPRATRTTGHRGTGRALACDGTTGYAASAVRVLNTEQSFAVSAWVRLDDAANPWQTAVSADGSATSSFFLQYSQGFNRWAFSITPDDVAVPTPARALSTAAPRVGEWTHLVGVYDAGTRTARLYVNGQVTGVVDVPSSWRAPGVLNVCRARHNGGPVDYFDGAVDDVRVIAGVPTDVDIVSLYNE
ncbi:LamG-like jellyroll fold domain-containing protein [Dactylosporangium sp. CA-092794]|uniref:LamG-like jellyroll fold domain-containing protein n=1 Tax=Dactylosporangium sp. CA-092794 TaxID=3239929 RepID=UPI003D8F7B28